MARRSALGSTPTTLPAGPTSWAARYVSRPDPQHKSTTVHPSSNGGSGAPNSWNVFLISAATLKSLSFASPGTASSALRVRAVACGSMPCAFAIAS